jgi:hypothetical protein
MTAARRQPLLFAKAVPWRHHRWLAGRSSTCAVIRMPERGPEAVESSGKVPSRQAQVGGAVRRD